MHRTPKQEDPKVVALLNALDGSDPFYTGICTVPEEQRNLYYTDASGIHRHIDFSKTSTDDLDTLYRTCKPAEFGRNGEDVLDESYRKAGKMDPVSFAALIDLHSLGIHEQISKALLTESNEPMETELYKLNVYGKGDFFKVHKDTPRAKNMFGSLVVVLPTPHEGGQLVLRQSKEWTIDFTDKFAKATEPSVCFVAFYGDIEHEVLPITSGYRVTLTYNLYHTPEPHITPSIPTPYHLTVRRALADLLNDKTKLPGGGYLGFGLVHEYVHTGSDLLCTLEDQLKGSDRALADACEVLDVPYFIRLLYRDAGYDHVNLLTTEELHIPDRLKYHPEASDYLQSALGRVGMSREQVEGIVFVGEDKPYLHEFYDEHLRRFYKDPMTEVLEVTRMKSSVDIRSPVLILGNSASLDYFYGTACMVLAVGPAESRCPVGL